MRVLIVEDDADNAAIIKRYLEEEQYRVDLAGDGPSGLRMALEETYDAIVLDLLLPGLDGWAVCESLRAQRVRTPILDLTARGAVEDRLRGFELGSDDYLSKPFELAELLARLRALQRRDKIHKGRRIKIAHLEIDTSLRQVRCAGIEIPLAPQEYALLEILAVNEGRVLSRDEIMTRVWRNEDSYSNSVDVHIGILRKKIDSHSDIKLLHTVRRMGYMLRGPESGWPGDAGAA